MLQRARGQPGGYATLIEAPEGYAVNLDSSMETIDPAAVQARRDKAAEEALHRIAGIGLFGVRDAGRIKQHVPGRRRHQTAPMWCR